MTSGFCPSPETASRIRFSRPTDRKTGPPSRRMAAGVNGDGRAFGVSGVKPLFDVHFPYAPYHAFDVAADGQRFLVNSLLLGPGGGPSRVAGLSFIQQL